MHPAQDEVGNQLYEFVIENLHLPHCARPQSVNLLQVLDEIFGTRGATVPGEVDDSSEPNVQKLREILLALIEDGNRHTYHDFGPPVWGKNSCARKAKRKGEAEEVYCRYLFPRDKLRATEDKRGAFREEPHRAGPRNRFLGRNDQRTKNCEEQLPAAETHI